MWWRNYDNVLSRFDRIPERVGRTGRQNCHMNIADGGSMQQTVREQVGDGRRGHGYIVRGGLGSHLSPCHSLLCTHNPCFPVSCRLRIYPVSVVLVKNASFSLLFELIMQNFKNVNLLYGHHFGCRLGRFLSRAVCLCLVLYFGRNILEAVDSL